MPVSRVYTRNWQTSGTTALAAAAAALFCGVCLCVVACVTVLCERTLHTHKHFAIASNIFIAHSCSFKQRANWVRTGHGTAAAFTLVNTLQTSSAAKRWRRRRRAVAAKNSITLWAVGHFKSAPNVNLNVYIFFFGRSLIRGESLQFMRFALLYITQNRQLHTQKHTHTRKRASMQSTQSLSVLLRSLKQPAHHQLPPRFSRVRACAWACTHACTHSRMVARDACALFETHSGHMWCSIGPLHHMWWDLSLSLSHGQSQVIRRRVRRFVCVFVYML